MSYRFHRNAIITGPLDCYCLACDSHIWSEDDANVHIGKPLHEKKLELLPYLQKYKDDFIRKVNKGYFCEFCNLLFSTAAKVGLHIEEAKHRNNKGIRFLKRVGNAVIAFEDILINEKAWNGVIDDTCVICNTEFFNVQIHKTDPQHIINLIQKDIEFGVENAIYRMVDDNSFQCLTCNMMYAKTAKSTHFRNETHKKLLTKCQEFDPSPIPKEELVDEAAKKATKSSDEVNQKSEILNFVKKEHREVRKTDNEKRLNIEEESTIDKSEANFTNDNYKKIDDKNAKEKMINDLLTVSSKTNASNQNEVSINADTATKVEKNESKVPSKQFQKAKILDNIPEFQKNGININFETETAICIKCFDSVDLKFEAIKAHIEDHKNNVIKSQDTELFKYSHTEVPKNTESVEFIDQNHNITVDVSTSKYKEKAVEKNTIDDKVDIDNNKKALVKFVPIISHADQCQNVDELCNEQKEDRKTKEVPKSSTQEPQDPEEFAKENRLTYNKGNNNAFCRLCGARIPASLRSMKEHVAGAAHRSKSSKVAEPKNKTIIPKKTMRKFIDTRIEIENMFSHDVVINDKFCLTNLSYLMISRHGLRYRCQACELNFTKYDIDDHTSSPRHEVAMDETPVVWSLHSEFMREVRPGLFHCGFCNLIAGCWEDVDKHLTCDEHRASKAAAERRLREHMPSIVEHRRSRRLMMMRMYMLGHFGPFF